MEDGILTQLPISNEFTKNVIVSDHNIFNQYKLSDDKALDLLKRVYLEKQLTEQPLVVLLHPSIIVKHKGVLTKFISFVKANDGRFISGDQWHKRLNAVSGKRIGVWIDLTVGDHRAEDLIADIKSIGVTDAFLLTKDYSGNPYYSTSRNNKGLFDEIYTALKLEKINVHAWIPVLLDRRHAKISPELAIFEATGKRSTEWLSPFRIGSQSLVNNEIELLLSNYEFEGIHLDYIRYSDLKSGLSEYAVNAFMNDTGLKDVKVNDLLTKHYALWTDWRALQITKFVKNIRELIDTNDRKIELSASLIAGAAVSHEQREEFGQDYSQLAKYLDLVIPMAYFKHDKNPVSWISNVIASTRYHIGNTDMMVGLLSFQEKGKLLTNKEFSDSVKLAVKGSEGIAFYNYLNLFGRGNKTWNMDAENVGFLQRYFSKKTKQLEPVNNIDNLGSHHVIATGSKLSTETLILGLIAIIATLMFIWCYIRKSCIHDKYLSHNQGKKIEADLSSIDFDTLEKKIHAKESISGELFEEVSMVLKKIGPHNISRFRRMRLLEILTNGPISLQEAQTIVSDSHDYLNGIRRIEEVGMLGYLEIDSKGILSITDLGKDLLERSIEDGYSLSLINFIDHRFIEHIIIDCLKCNGKTVGHWFWQNFECSECSHKSEVSDALNISLSK